MDTNRDIVRTIQQVLDLLGGWREQHDIFRELREALGGLVGGCEVVAAAQELDRVLLKLLRLASFWELTIAVQGEKSVSQLEIRQKAVQKA